MELLTVILTGLAFVLAGLIAYKLAILKKPYLYNSGSGETHKDKNCRHLFNANFGNFKYISKRRFNRLRKKGLANGCAFCFPEADDDSTNLSDRLMRYLFKVQ